MHISSVSKDETIVEVSVHSVYSVQACFRLKDILHEGLKGNNGLLIHFTPRRIQQSIRLRHEVLTIQMKPIDFFCACKSIDFSLSLLPPLN